MTRAFLGGLSLASILFAPPWIPFLCMGALVARFCAWEALFLAGIVDLLYVPTGGIWGIPMPTTLILFIALVSLEPVRQKLLL